VAVEVDLALLAVQAGFCEAAPDKPRRYKVLRGQPPRMKCCANAKKCLFGILLGRWDEKLLWKHHQPGV
jgi:hypothetical protein